MRPLKLLKETLNWSKLEKSKAGMVPLRWLFCARNMFRPEILDKFGKGPEISLFEMSRLFKLFNMASELGMSPVSLFPLRCRWVSCLQFPISDAITPLILLPSRLRKARDAARGCKLQSIATPRFPDKLSLSSSNRFMDMFWGSQYTPCQRSLQGSEESCLQIKVEFCWPSLPETWARNCISVLFTSSSTQLVMFRRKRVVTNTTHIEIISIWAKYGVWYARVRC